MCVVPKKSAAPPAATSARDRTTIRDIDLAVSMVDPLALGSSATILRRMVTGIKPIFTVRAACAHPAQFPGGCANLRRLSRCGRPAATAVFVTGIAPGLFMVLRQMPEEFQAYDLKYRIRNQREGFERTVLECHLTATNGGEDAYAKVTALRRYAGR